MNQRLGTSFNKNTQISDATLLDRREYDRCVSVLMAAIHAKTFKYTSRSIPFYSLNLAPRYIQQQTRIYRLSICAHTSPRAGAPGICSTSFLFITLSTQLFSTRGSIIRFPDMRAVRKNNIRAWRKPKRERPASIARSPRSAASLHAKLFRKFNAALTRNPR